MITRLRKFHKNIDQMRVELTYQYQPVDYLICHPNKLYYSNQNDFFKIIYTKLLLLIKKILQFWDREIYIKKLSNDNYVYIVYQRVLSPWDRTQALTCAIRAVSLP